MTWTYLPMRLGNLMLANEGRAFRMHKGQDADQDGVLSKED